MFTFRKLCLTWFFRAGLFIGLGATITQAHAENVDQLLGEYTALLSAKDRISTSGERHTTIADVLIQDRLNFHELNRADSLDEGDDFFSSEAKRELIRQLLSNRPIDNETADAIVYERAAIVWVSIFRAADGIEYFSIVAL